MKYKILNTSYEPVVETCPGDINFRNNVEPQVIEQSKAFSTTDVGSTFVGNQYDDHYLSNVGWDVISQDNTGYRLFFSKENMTRISKEITQQLIKAGYPMIVTNDVISGVMSGILRNHTPTIGDIYTQYTIPQNIPRNDIANLNSRVVNTIVSTIINEQDMKKWNESLNIWDTVYGDFNRKGLRAHSIIRKRDNDYLKGQFNLNY
jgi:hypothetical protein